MATVPAGTSTYAGTSTSTPSSITFADRYGFVNVVNTGSAVLYVTGDGSTPASAGAGSGIAVEPGSSALVANGLEIWHQDQNVIPAGSNQFGNGNTQTSPASPGMVQSQTALAGHMPNPGTNITLVGASTFTLEGTG